MNYYDYIILGSGPTGLTLAWYLSKSNKKVLIVEKNNRFGGIHSVDRSKQKNLFSEHGPRIYLDNYYNFISMLDDMNLSFNNYFVPYNFGMSAVGGKSIGYFSIYEIMILTYAFLTIHLNNSYKTQTMDEFTTRFYFSDKTKWYIDRLCRLTDGGGIERYTVYQFLQIINQNLLFNIYQPNKPNDIGILKDIGSKILGKKNIDIRLNSTITHFNTKDDKIVSVVLNNSNTIKAQNIILAIPPYNIVDLLQNTSQLNAFGDFNELKYFEKQTRYLQYICITFHWDEKQDIKKVWGFPDTDWGIAYIVLSDYMNFDNKESKTVISLAITTFNKSSNINKTPNECSQEELINESFNQLKISQTNLKYPNNIVFNQNYYENNKWNTKSNAYFNYKDMSIDFQSPIYKNLYNCGAHNGKSNYSFNALETAVVNALTLVHILEPYLKKYKIKIAPTILNLLFKIVAIFIILFSTNIKFTTNTIAILSLIFILLLSNYPKFQF